MVTRLTRLGATTPELAEALEVAPRTVERWMAADAVFRRAVKEGKIIADMSVTDSLYQRTQFYRYTKQVPIKVKTVLYDQGKRVSEVERVEIVEVEEVLPPDTTAIIYWSKNRRPNEWRDRREVAGNLTVSLADLLAEAHDPKAG